MFQDMNITLCESVPHERCLAQCWQVLWFEAAQNQHPFDRIVKRMEL
jgi:hypothetical protein